MSSSPPELPIGIVTFLYTDVVGSTRRARAELDSYREALVIHNELIRGAAVSCAGVQYSKAGDGYAFAFSSPSNAVRCAIEMQREMQQTEWPTSEPITIRIGAFTGYSGDLIDGDYACEAANYGARVRDLASPGTIIVCDQTVALADPLPLGARSSFLGLRPLEGVTDRQFELYQIRHPDLVDVHVSVSQNNLPRLPHRFVGRSRELDQLTHKLLNDRIQLLTLFALGGIGKTTTAIHLGQQLGSHYKNGVWFIECENLQTDLDFLQALSSALGIGLPEGDAIEWLRREIGSQSSLFIFDCFENAKQLAHLVTEIVKYGPAQCLVTSREPLNIAHEHRMELPPLQFRGNQAEAAELFAVCAEKYAGVEIARPLLPTVTKICTALEGWPLAIELAAGRLNVLSPAELLQEIQQDPLVLLKGEGRGKHQSIEHVVVTTLDRLDKPDLRLMVSCSGWFGEMSAVDMSELSGLSHLDVLETLQRLVSHALVRAVSRGGGNTTLYRLQDVVREVLRKKCDSLLSPAQIADLQKRHYQLCLRHAVEIDRLAKVGQLSASRQLLSSQIANIRESIRIASRNQDESALRLLYDHLARQIFERGSWADFEDLCNAIESCVVSDNALRLSMLGLKGAMQRRLGLENAARDTWCLRQQLAANCGDRECALDTMIDLGIQAHERGDADLARQYFSDAAQSAVEQDNRMQYATVLSLQADACALAGDTEQVHSHVAQSQLEMDSLPDGEEKLFVYKTLGNALLSVGDLLAARLSLQMGFRLAIEMGRDLSAGRILLVLARCFSVGGDEVRALACLSAAAKIAPGISTTLSKEVASMREEFSSDSNRDICAELDADAATLGWKTFANEVILRAS